MADKQEIHVGDKVLVYGSRLIRERIAIVSGETKGLKPKDLREFRENFSFNGSIGCSLIGTVKTLKNIFSAPVRDICKYIRPYQELSYYETIPQNEEAIKKLRIKLRYMANLYEAGVGLRIYLDYLRCVNRLGEENRKRWPIYPKDYSKIRDLHDEVVEVLNRERERIQAARQVEKQKMYLENFYEKAKELEIADDTYTIIAVKDLMDLVKEGRVLNHCVGSYINSVSEGREYILFLRKKESVETPFYTIDVTPDKKVRQIHGYGNRNLSNEVRPFVNKWAKKFNLDISNCSGVYCALK